MQLPLLADDKYTDDELRDAIQNARVFRDLPQSAKERAYVLLLRDMETKHPELEFWVSVERGGRYQIHCSSR